MLNNRRHLRVVTAAGTLTACVGYLSAAVAHDSALGVRDDHRCHCHASSGAPRHCTAPQIQVVDELPWPGAYIRTIQPQNKIWTKRSAAESGGPYRILVRELIHCALCEQREKRGMRHPRGLELEEEMMVQGLTDKLLGS